MELGLLYVSPSHRRNDSNLGGYLLYMGGSPLGGIGMVERDWILQYSWCQVFMVDEWWWSWIRPPISESHKEVSICKSGEVH